MSTVDHASDHLQNSSVVKNDTLDKTPLSLASVLQEIETWRSQKSSFNEPMPEAIWKKIFTLAEQYSIKRVCSFLNIGVAHYNKKFQLFHSQQSSKNESSKPLKDISEIELCEVKIKNPIFEPLQIPTNTIIAEFYRADGKLMKIHCLSERFHELITAFYAGDTHDTNHS